MSDIHTYRYSPSYLLLLFGCIRAMLLLHSIRAVYTCILYSICVSSALFLSFCRSVLSIHVNVFATLEWCYWARLQANCSGAYTLCLVVLRYSVWNETFVSAYSCIYVCFEYYNHFFSQLVASSTSHCCCVCRVCMELPPVIDTQQSNFVRTIFTSISSFRCYFDGPSAAFDTVYF